MRRSARRLRRAPTFEFAPMVDVVLVLVLFLMVSAAIVRPGRGLAVDLPAASTGKPASSLPQVTLSANGTVSLDGQSTTVAALEASLRRSLPGTAGAVSLRADRNARHGRVVELMDAIKRSGATRLSVAVKEP